MSPTRSLPLLVVLATLALAAITAEAAPPSATAPSTDLRLARLSSLSPLARQLEDRWSAGRARRPRPPMAFPIRGRADYGGAAARFGNDRGSHIHAGQDVFAPSGTPLVAISDAIVLEEGGGDARGNYVVLYDRSRRRTFAYFHMQARAAVRRGRRVRAGHRVGRVGCTGRCFGPHLHLEVHRGRGLAGAVADPLPLLRRLERR
jgi:murein DD-endopeptidase MepM/ murein hydrolase activator NlpD